MQLLVLGRSRGEDGRHAQDGGGSGWVPHLVDHDGGQDHTQDLQDKAGVRKRPKQPQATVHFLLVRNHQVTTELVLPPEWPE